MPNVNTPSGVSLAIHDAIKARLNDPDSYKYIGVDPPTAAFYEKRHCWILAVNFRAKNAFGGYVQNEAIVYVAVTSGGQETVLYVYVGH
jgi:hypothetical protein